MHFNFLKTQQGTYLQGLWTLGPYSGIHDNSVIVHADMSVQLSSFHISLEIYYDNFQEWQNLKTYVGTYLQE